jgi:hypothetical protein
MKVYVVPEEIEASLKSLGPPGTRAESNIWLAAQIAVHVMRGGTLELDDRCNSYTGYHSNPHKGCILR